VVAKYFKVLIQVIEKDNSITALSCILTKLWVIYFRYSKLQKEQVGTRGVVFEKEFRCKLVALNNNKKYMDHMQFTMYILIKN